MDSDRINLSQGKVIEYQIVRSSRKTIGIQVSAAKGVIVRAPNRINKKKIKEIVLKKSNWIIKKLKGFSDIKPARASLEFVDGEYIYYLGEAHRLVVKKSMDIKKVQINYSEKYFEILFPAGLEEDERKEVIKDSMIKWYREAARLKISDRIKNYQKYVSKKPAKIRIKSQKTIWGSCSSKRNLNFNWKLIMAPLPVLDYIVVHELVHLDYPNHSADFWAKLRSIIPDYKEKQEWLRVHGLLLDI